MAPLRLSCPHCKARMTALDPDRAKRSITCPRCHKSFAPGSSKPPSSAALDTAALEGTEPWQEEPPGSLLESPHLMRWLLVGGGAVLAVVVVAAVLLLRQPARPAGGLVATPGGEQARKEKEKDTSSRSVTGPDEGKDRVADGGAVAVADGGPRKAAGQAGSPFPGGRCALLVGVRDYDSSKLLPLKYTENDVEELAEILKRPEAGFSFLRLLTTTRGKKNPDDAPTAANIRAAVARLLEKRKRDDLVLVALAGHGLTLKDESYFCPSDMEWNEPGGMVSLPGLFRQIDDSGAGVKLLVVDACRNDPTQGRSVDVDTVPRPPRGMAALYSCSSGERAFESATLGKGHGIFFHYFLEGLRGKALNEEKEVTWARLTEYVTSQVPRSIPRLVGQGAKQTPHLVSNLTGSPPVLLRAGDRWRERMDRGKELLDQHEYEPAIQALTEASQASPNEPLPHAYRALAQALRGKLPEAREDCDKALTLNKGLAEAVAVRARVHALGKEPDAALAEAMEAVRLDGKSALVLTCRAFVHWRMGNLDQALRDAEKAVGLDAKLALAYDDRGQIWLAKKDPAKAVADFSKALEIAPKFAAAYTHRGNAYRAGKKGEDAKADYSKALALDKKDGATTYLNQGIASLQDKQYDDAIKQLSEAVKLDPDSPSAYNELGRAYAGRKDFGKAIESFNEALARDPDLADAYQNRGFAYLDSGNSAKAIADFTRLGKLAGDNAALRAYAYRALGDVYAQQRSYDKAIEALTAAIDVDPDYAWSWATRGLMYMAKNMPAQAVKDYTRAINLIPRWAIYYQNRGSAYATLKRYQEAIADFTRAIKLDPRLAEAYKNRGTVYKELKQFAKASEDFARYEKLKGNR
jgi:tetratricopeptide (TPR) repeat protein